MSELLIVEDDPDPLPGGEANLFLLNELMPDASPRMVAAETLLAERELAYYEKEAVGRLSMRANRILSLGQSGDDYEDCRVVSGDVMLRRRVTERKEAGRTTQSTAYFYVDKTNGQNYCRSWSLNGDRVNWCYQEDRHEPADDVLARLERVFPFPDRASAEQGFAARVLAKLRRT